MYNQIGETIYDISKLDGKIISTFNIDGKNYKPNRMKDNMVFTLSKQGFMKRTNIQEYIAGDTLKPVRNSVACKLRENDKLVQCLVIPKKVCDELNAGILIYTKLGDYVYLKNYEEISEFGKNTYGLQVIEPGTNDACIGFSLVIPQYNKHALVVTKKGCMKRIEIQYLGESKKRKDSSYIATIREGDEILDIIVYDEAMNNGEIVVATRSGDKQVMLDSVPILGRKAKPVKIMGIENADVVTLRNKE